jgi:hypothetical protein
MNATVWGMMPSNAGLNEKGHVPRDVAFVALGTDYERKSCRIICEFWLAIDRAWTPSCCCVWRAWS